MPEKKQLAGRVLPIIAFAVAALLMVWIRVLVGAAGEAKLGQSFLEKGDLASAIHHFDRSIHWYTPFSGAVSKSISGIEQAAKAYQQRGDQEGALYAWRVLRSALYSVRHVRQPHGDVIAKADGEIAQYMAARIGVPGTEAFEKELAIRTGQLSKKVGPKTGWALLAEFGFFGWVAATFLFIWFGLRPKKGFVTRPAIILGSIIVIFYAFWILGLARA